MIFRLNVNEIKKDMLRSQNNISNAHGKERFLGKNDIIITERIVLV